MAAASAAVLELLEWLARRPRTYAETISAWQSHCPRLSAWEDALAEGYVRPERGGVVLTKEGGAALAEAARERVRVYESAAAPRSVAPSSI